MTEPIKLTADDIDFIHWEKDSGGTELFELIIYGKSKSDCNKIKAQILENQEKAENYDNYKNCCQHSEDEYCIWDRELHIAESKIVSLKEKLEKIEKLSFHAGCNGNPNCTLCPIMKILRQGEKK